MSGVYLAIYFNFGCTFLPNSMPKRLCKHIYTPWPYSFQESADKTVVFFIDSVRHTTISKAWRMLLLMSSKSASFSESV